jgi:glycosyltransferase involved in cell wall biosynthesis
MKMMYMKMSRSVAAVHTPNTSEYYVIRSFGFKCYYVPLGIDTDLFNIGPKSNRFTVIFVGPRYGKGADMLSKIVPKVLRKAPDIKFALAGKGFLNEYFTSLGSIFRNNVEVCGWLEQKELAKLLSTSHILLFPSRYETFGLVAVEALSSGMPVLCFDIPGAPRDIIKKYGVGVVAHPFSVDEMANGILAYYGMWKNQREEFDILSSTCRNVALGFDWSIIANLFEKMFREVLSPKYQL